MNVVWMLATALSAATILVLIQEWLRRKRREEMKAYLDEMAKILRKDMAERELDAEENARDQNRVIHLRKGERG